ncbi:MAG: LysR substrate-binding domain-containing protein [Kofleriaceae bacterium]
MEHRELPPLTALRAFEAAARRASFKAAAAELYVTPTAISHQLRQLEAWLGVRVLERSPRAVALTAAGAELYDAVAAGLSEIGRVTSRLRRATAPATLTLSATSGFLSQWLVPRLAEVQRVLPALDLRLHAAESVVALGAGRVEVAIRYGTGPYPGVQATALCADHFAPLCSPRLGVTGAAELRRAKLLHIEGRRVPRPEPTWARWCAHAGIARVNTGAGLRFTDGLHAAQAAIAGQGIALLSLVLVADALASGLLVQPFRPVLRGATYHFVCAPEIAARADVVALRTWFQQRLTAP